jgi:hypothetical protein
MKSLFLVLAVLFSAVFIAGCAGGAKDCGSVASNSPTDPARTCFKEAMSNCSSAKIVVDSRALQPAGGAGAVVYAEVRGGTAPNCVFYERIEQIFAPTGLTQEQQAAYDIIAAKMKGMNMVCNFTAEDVDTVMTPGNMANHEICTKCIGSLADYNRDTGACWNV